MHIVSAGNKLIKNPYFVLATSTTFIHQLCHTPPCHLLTSHLCKTPLAFRFSD